MARLARGGPGGARCLRSRRGRAGAVRGRPGRMGGRLGAGRSSARPRPGRRSGSARHAGGGIRGAGHRRSRARRAPARREADLVVLPGRCMGLSFPRQRQVGAARLVPLARRVAPRLFCALRGPDPPTDPRHRAGRHPGHVPVRDDSAERLRRDG
ncbi:MAG: hypothetical protein AMK73_08105 [Planctomycetes bacterium SM23_32]|nr:MAG: hypothetical protein AMK73_08105 [Planctomycetes bacterium SM23_32]